MRFKGRYQAYNAEVEMCALFATRNSLKLQEVQKVFLPIRNIHARTLKLWSRSEPAAGVRGQRRARPASETLVWGPSVSNKKNVTHVSHFVTSADGLAAMVAPCSAALSSQAPKPRPARRRRGA